MAKIIQFNPAKITYTVNISDDCSSPFATITNLGENWKWCVHIFCSSFDQIQSLKSEGDQMVRKAMTRAV